MAPIETAVQIEIDIGATSPVNANFGSILVATAHSVAGPRLRPISSIAAAELAGFNSTDEPGTWRILERIFTQRPAPTSVVLAKRLLLFTQIVRLAPTVLTEGHVYAFSIGDKTYTYTVLAGASLASVCTALEALIGGDPPTGLDTVDASSGTWLEFTSDPGFELSYFVQANTGQFVLSTHTVNPGIETDLAEIYDLNSDWYGLLIDSNSPAEVLAAAAWVEGAKRVLFADTSETSAYDPAAVSWLSQDLATAELKRTALFLHADIGRTFAAGALVEFLAKDPGTATLAYKVVRGSAAQPFPVVPWNALQRETAMQQRFYNVYETVSSVSYIRDGTLAYGEFCDVIRYRDFLKSDLSIRCLQVLIDNDIMPLTRATVKTFVLTISNGLDAGVKLGALRGGDDEPEFAPQVTSIDIAAMDPEAIRRRRLTGIGFTAFYTGAVHFVGPIYGTLSVTLTA